MNSHFLHPLTNKSSQPHKLQNKEMNPMFYFLLVSTAVLAATAKAGEPVVDTDGNLISNGSYYAVPVSHHEGALIEIKTKIVTQQSNQRLKLKFVY